METNYWLASGYMMNQKPSRETSDVDTSASADCSAFSRVYRCKIYLKDQTTVEVETNDPIGFQKSLSGFMDTFYRRGLFRKVNSVVKLCGKPEVHIPIGHINFYVIQEQTDVGKVNPMCKQKTMASIFSAVTDEIDRSREAAVRLAKMTAEEADAAYAASPEIPITEDEIRKIVANVTGS